MSEELIIKPDRNGANTMIVPQADYINNVVLAANTDESFNIPAGYTVVMFSSSSDFWCKIDGTAAVPAVDVTNGTGSELNPTARNIEGCSTISLESETACKISMAFYK